MSSTENLPGFIEIGREARPDLGMGMDAEWLMRCRECDLGAHGPDDSEQAATETAVRHLDHYHEGWRDRPTSYAQAALGRVSAEMPGEADLLARAARLVRERAQAADTGEAWEADRHYDSLWVVDFKPSVGPSATVDDRRSLGLYPEDHEAEQPADVACNARQAAHIALWDPAVALAVAGWLEHEAGTARDAENRHRLLGAPLEYPHEVLEAVAIARALLGEETTDD